MWPDKEGFGERSSPVVPWLGAMGCDGLQCVVRPDKEGCGAKRSAL
jgi:hypothetical protein